MQTSMIVKDTGILIKDQQASSTEKSSFENIQPDKETPIIKAMQPAIQESYKSITYADKTFAALASALLFTGEFGTKFEETLVQKTNPWSGSINFEERQTSEINSGFDEAEITNNDRLELLARRYELKKLPAEDAARLAILTERIRLLIPRVTEKDFQILEVMANELNNIEERRLSLLRRLEDDQS